MSRLKHWLDIVNTTAVLDRLRSLSNKGENILENREEVCESIDCLLSRMALPAFNNRSLFVQSGGCSIILKILQAFQGERGVSEAAFHLFVLLLNADRKKNHTSDDSQRTATAVHLSGMSQIIYDVFELHEEDDDIRLLGKTIIKDLISAGANASLTKIVQIGKALEIGLSYEVYLQAEQKLGTPSRKHHENDEVPDGIYHSADTKVTEIELILLEMQKYMKHEKVQRKGLEIIHKYMETKESSLEKSSFLNETMAAVLVIAITSPNHNIQRLGLSILMRVTSEPVMCTEFMKQEGCATLMAFLENKETKCSGHDLNQIAIWSLSNLCKEERCREELERLGLKAYLYDIVVMGNHAIEESIEVTELVVPLSLRLQYTVSDMEEAKRFHVSSLQKVLCAEEMKRTGTIDTSLPKPRNAGPNHGTTEDIFQHGDPGLI